ncbi:MAG: DVU0298 family protein [Syntrophobacteraceae bacterium]
MRALRKRVEAMLRSESFNDRLSEWELLPGRQAINPLLSFLFHREEIIKWRAVTAIGVVVAHLADSDMESARNIMRRLIWSLNDESGGIGWGSAEAMGEIMARHERVAIEFACILVSYIRSDCNPLENRFLERGVLWGIGRLAQSRPQMLEGCKAYLLPYLSSEDGVHRAMAAWTLSFVSERPPEDLLRRIVDDPTEIAFYEDGILSRRTVGELAGRLKG